MNPDLFRRYIDIVRKNQADPANAGEYDREGEMAQQNLTTAADAAEELRSILDADENLPEWVQSKITKAVDYLDTVRDYMKSKEQGVAEGFASPELEDKVRARLRELEEVDPDNMYKIVADEFDMTEDDLRAALYDELNEEQTDEGNPVMNAITSRIMRTRPDLLDNDLHKLQAAIRDVALDVGDVDEIDSRDISGWVKRVEQILSGTGMAEGVETLELAEEFDLIESVIENLAESNGVDSEVIWEDLESLTDDELYVFAVTAPIMEDWQKANKRDRTDGMSRKAVKAYRRENPGSKLQTAVTTKPSKLKKGSKASKRRKSYCSRSRGQMKMHSISCAKTPDKAICKARRRWNCESQEVSAENLVVEGKTFRDYLARVEATVKSKRR